MAARKSTLASTLATIAEAAPQLRKAGVLTVEADGVCFTLAPHEEAPDSKPAQAVDPEWPMDPLHDPATYPGGRVPGFTREES